jgi:sorbitol-specific phosphotransferase system component IIA
MKVGDSAQRYLNELEHAVLSFEYETVVRVTAGSPERYCKGDRGLES